MRSCQDNRCHFFCFVLAVLLFFSGMCLRLERVDSFFSYSSFSHSSVSYSKKQSFVSWKQSKREPGTFPTSKQSLFQSLEEKATGNFPNESAGKAAIRRLKQTVPATALCTSELLGSRTSFSAILQTRQRTKQETLSYGLRLLFLLLCLLLPASCLAFLAVWSKLYYDSSVTTAIIHYIHNQDGKKSLF